MLRRKTPLDTDEGWLHVAAVKDMATCEIVGWSMDTSLHSPLAERALTMAVQRHNPPEGLIHHSDRGVQYASGPYRKILSDRKLTASMSRKGNCLDNAPMDSFTRKLVDSLSRDHDLPKVDMMERLSHQLRGWAAFYRFADHTAWVFRRIDHVVFWKVAHWLARKYRSRIKPLMRAWYRARKPEQAKTWLVFGVSAKGRRIGKALYRLVSSPKGQFRWRNPGRNPDTSGNWR